VNTNFLAKDVPAFPPKETASITDVLNVLCEEHPSICHISAHIKNDIGANAITLHQYSAHVRL
jgi:hypothetical protein